MVVVSDETASGVGLMLEVLPGPPDLVETQMIDTNSRICDFDGRPDRLRF